GKTVDNGAAWNPDGIDMVYVAGTGSGILAQNGFYIGKYEVTQAQWQAIMGSNPSGFAGCSDCPVENISWDDVKNFIGKLNSKTGRNYRLPTEKEWEYAAQGGANPKNIYEYAGGNSCGKVAWHSNNSNKRTHPVGSKKPNPLGIYDMSGNVLEWCENHFDDNSPFRVIRGGSWNNDAEDCRIVNRYGTSPGDRGGNVGFRLVLSE
ncbi:MAG: formylglycine-generating enzyme family protein, partial [Prevotellaceae bacterium]|nr:formylglycine-generating enzyme family protein [Prevotellaceae bacterium]